MKAIWRLYMAEKLYYHDINMAKVSQLLNARAQNVTSAQMATLAATLDGSNKGLFVYNTDDNKNYTWNGTEFVADTVEVIGQVVFKGDINPANAAIVGKVSGFQYVVSAAGTLAAAGVTFTPSAEVEIGDVVLFTSETSAIVVQRNDVNSTETVAGNIRLATQAEVDTGLVTDEAVTPATLKGKLDPILAAQAAKDLGQDNRLTAVEAKNVEQDGRLDSAEDRLDAVEAKNIEQDGRLTAIEGVNTAQDGRLTSLEADRVKHYFATVNLVAGTPLNVSHALNLANANGFVVNTTFGGSQVSLDIDVVDANTIALTSLVPLTGVNVTVIGRSAV